VHLVGFIIKIYQDARSPERYFIKQVVAALQYVKGSLLRGVLLLGNPVQNTIHGVLNAR